MRAVAEMDLVEIARDPGADLDLVDCLEATDEVVPFADVFHHRLRDGDRGRSVRRCALSLDRCRRNERRNDDGGPEEQASCTTQRSRA